MRKPQLEKIIDLTGNAYTIYLESKPAKADADLLSRAGMDLENALVRFKELYFKKYGEEA